MGMMSLGLTLGCSRRRVSAARTAERALTELAAEVSQLGHTLPHLTSVAVWVPTDVHVVPGQVHH